MVVSRLLLVAAMAMSLLVAAEAAQARKKLAPSPDYPGKCYDPDQQLVLAPGDSQPAEGQCTLYQCLTSGDDFELLISSCGSVGVGNGCVLVTKDPSLPYPQCCPEPQC